MDSKRLLLFAGIILAVILVLTVIRSCTITDKYSVLVGEYNALKARYDIDTKVLTEEIGHQNEIIEAAQREIELLLETRVENERRLSVYKAQLEELVYEEPVQPELEHEPLVVNLRQQIAKMSLVISEQEQIIRGNDKIIFNLTEKYKAQLVISEDYKRLYENEVQLHSLAMERVKLLESRVRGLRFGTQLKNGVIVAAIGIGAYLLLR